jgi:translocator protein
MHTRVQHHETVLDHPWRIAALVGVIANVTFNLLNGRIGDSVPSIADVSDKYATLFTPAGYAFAIWGVIYGGTLTYSVLALMPSQFDVQFHDRVAPWLLLTNALASLWVALFTAEHLGPSLLIILAALTSAVVMYAMVSDHILSEHISHYWRLPFGLWLGWLAISSLAHLSLSLGAGGLDFAVSSPWFTVALLLLASLVTVGVSTLFLDPVLPLVTSWATISIAVAHFGDSTLVGVVALLIGIKSLALGARLLAWSNLPMSPLRRERIEFALRFMPERAKR